MSPLFDHDLQLKAPKASDATCRDILLFHSNAMRGEDGEVEGQLACQNRKEHPVKIATMSFEAWIVRDHFQKGRVGFPCLPFPAGSLSPTSRAPCL